MLLNILAFSFPVLLFWNRFDICQKKKHIFFKKINVHFSHFSFGVLYNLLDSNLFFRGLSNMPEIRDAGPGNWLESSMQIRLARKSTVEIYLTSQMRHPSLLSHWAATGKKMFIFLQPPVARSSHKASLLSPACLGLFSGLLNKPCMWLKCSQCKNKAKAKTIV